MKCYDLFKLPSLKSLEIISGSEGLNREIKWIYFADIIELNDCDKWIDEKELIFITGKHLNGNFDVLCQMLSVLDGKLSSGIVLNLGDYISEIPDELKKRADELKLPLFCLPWETRLTDVSKEIGNYILLANQSSDAYTEFLNELLFRKDLRDEDLANLILNTEFPFEKPCRIAVLFYCQNYREDQSEAASSPDANQYISMNHFLLFLIKSSLNALKIPVKMTQNNNQTIFLIEDSELIQSMFTQMIENMQVNFQKRYPSFYLFMGIGNAYSTPYEYKKSYTEALKAVQVTIASPNEKIVFYERLGYWGILVNSSDRQQMRDFYYRLLGEIIEYDRGNKTNLLETLYVFLFSGQNSQDTANTLHLHKNTLKYRISKIETLLNSSLKDPETITNIMLAHKISKLLNLN